MKFYLDKRKIDEITLTYMEINLLINPKNTYIYKYIYDFVTNSNLLDNKIKNILYLYDIGECMKSYDNLLISSDISNSFYDKLSNQLIYIEFLNIVKYSKQADLSYLENNSKNITDLPKDKFLSNIYNNKYISGFNQYQNHSNSYFGDNESLKDDMKESFFKKRFKIIKFFNIHLDKIKNFKVESCDLRYITEEINYRYKIILKLFKVFNPYKNIIFSKIIFIKIFLQIGI